MSSPSPSSLRDFYAPPPDAWSFLPPETNTTTLPQASTSTSYQWSTRTTTNPIFDLSTSYVEDESSVNVDFILKGLLPTLVLRYAHNALVMPWDVGKVLLQVQWIPRDAGEAPPGAVLTTDGADEDEALSDTSNDNETYFADPSKLDSVSETLPAPRLADEQGYIVRQSILEEGTIPEYVIPLGAADGIWGMMKQIGRFRSEGWLSLWKGLLTTTINRALFSALQPVCLNVLQSVLSPVIPSLPSAPTSLSYSYSPLVVPIASHILTGFLLSPLDLVRTRLIVQSSLHRHRSYSGPIDALQQILAYEGGLRGVYLHPHLLIPTLADCTLRAVVPLVFPRIVASYFGANVTPETNPLLWNFADFLGSCAGLLLILPVETVRRRLQVQVRGSAKPVKACVEVRPAPYNGVVDALWHVATEERSDLPIKHRSRKHSGKGKHRELAGEDVEESGGWLRNTGIGQLYRGLGFGLSVNAVLFVCSILSREEPDEGWAEL